MGSVVVELPRLCCCQSDRHSVAILFSFHASLNPCKPLPLKERGVGVLVYRRRGGYPLEQEGARYPL